MSEELKGVQNPGEGKQPDSQTPAEDKKQPEDTISAEGQGEDSKEIGKVEVDSKELETLRKKAEDFDGIIEKQRLAKMAKKDKPETADVIENNISEDDIVKHAEEAARRAADARFQELNQPIYEGNLKTALRTFLNDNKWADDDNKLDRISASLAKNSAFSSQEIIAQLNKAALENFPDEYAKSMESKIKSRIYAEETNINAGGGGATAGVPGKEVQDVDVSKASAEDIRIAQKYFRGDVARYLKSKQKA